MDLNKELNNLSSLLDEKGFNKESGEIKDIRESFVLPPPKVSPRRITKVQEQNRERKPLLKEKDVPFAEEDEEITELRPGKKEETIKYKERKFPITEPELGLRPKSIKKLASIIGSLEIKGYNRLAKKLANASLPIINKVAAKEQHTLPYIEKVYEKSDSLSDLINNLKDLSDFYNDMNKHINAFIKAHGNKKLEDKNIIQMVRKADRETEQKILKLMKILNNKNK
jgi:hypothetical protein